MPPHLPLQVWLSDSGTQQAPVSSAQIAPAWVQQTSLQHVLHDALQPQFAPLQVQVPPLQVVPAAQATPQPPQFAESVCRLKHFLPHFVVGGLHFFFFFFFSAPTPAPWPS